MSDRPRILLIGGHGGLSGVPRHLRHLTRALEPHADVTVAHDIDTGGYGFAKCSVTVRGLATAPHPVRLWRAWRWCQRMRATSDFDLIWAHARMPVLLLRLGPRRTATPLMLSYHGLPFDPGHRPLARRIGRGFEAILLRMAPPMTLVVLSDAAATALRRALPHATRRHRIAVLPNSSDLGPVPLAPRTGAPRIVMTGRVSWQKNLVAAARLLAAWPDARLTLCGEGTDSERFGAALHRAVDASTLARIDRRGPVADVGPLLAKADLYLLTSRYEGVPIGALEAFEAGLPLALPRGHHDLLDHHPLSAAIDPDDPVAAATTVQALVEAFRKDPAGWADRIRTAWAEHYGFDAFATRLHAVVETAMKS